MDAIPDRERHRRSRRLPHFDYRSPSAYFVTICTADRQPLPGRIERGEIRLSLVGEIVTEEWLRAAVVRANVDLDAFVVMPNHLHGIVVIHSEPIPAREPETEDMRESGVGATRRVAPTSESVDGARSEVTAGDVRAHLETEDLHQSGVGATRRVAPTQGEGRDAGKDRRHRIPVGPPSGSLGAIIGQFKSITTKRVNLLHPSSKINVWQRNFYEHVIRNEHDLAEIREYVMNNPLRWLDDENYREA